MRKILKAVVVTSTIVGIVTILGAAGKADYTAETQQMWSTASLLKMLAGGIVLTLPAPITFMLGVWNE